MNNIDSFNIAVAEVFGRCYREFPLPISINIGEIADQIKTSSGKELGDLNSRDVEYKIAKASIEWLIDAEYLSSGSNTSHDFRNVILTTKGLEVLNAIPETLQDKESIGEKLSGGVAKIGTETAVMVVKEGLSFGIKVLTGSP